MQASQAAQRAKQKSTAKKTRKKQRKVLQLVVLCSTPCLLQSASEGPKLWPGDIDSTCWVPAPGLKHD